ncbi:MAG: cytochrome c oxidase assembly factor Coa1 family protein [Flavobacterium sp.]
MENYYPYPQPRKNWFQRNWKWFVPTGCLTLIIIAGLVITGIYFGVTSFMKDSDVYKHSLEAAQKNPQVIQQIGNPVEAGEMITGNISTSGTSGEADLDIPVQGPKGKGTIHVVAYKEHNVWLYTTLLFNKEGSYENVDLLATQQ